MDYLKPAPWTGVSALRCRWRRLDFDQEGRSVPDLNDEVRPLVPWNSSSCLDCGGRCGGSICELPWWELAHNASGPKLCGGVFSFCPWEEGAGDQVDVTKPWPQTTTRVVEGDANDGIDVLFVNDVLKDSGSGQRVNPDQWEASWTRQISLTHAFAEVRIAKRLKKRVMLQPPAYDPAKDHNLNGSCLYACLFFTGHRKELSLREVRQLCRELAWLWMCCLQLLAEQASAEGMDVKAGWGGIPELEVYQGKAKLNVRIVNEAGKQMWQGDACQTQAVTLVFTGSHYVQGVVLVGQSASGRSLRSWPQPRPSRQSGAVRRAWRVFEQASPPMEEIWTRPGAIPEPDCHGEHAHARASWGRLLLSVLSWKDCAAPTCPGLPCYAQPEASARTCQGGACQRRSQSRGSIP